MRFAIILFAFIMSGCTAKYSTLDSGGMPQKIYDLTPTEAQKIVVSVFNEKRPGRKIFPLKLKKWGYYTFFRYPADPIHQTIFIIPVKGFDMSGRRRNGVAFEVFGGGTNAFAASMTTALYDKLIERLGETGNGFVATGVQQRSYQGWDLVDWDGRPMSRSDKVQFLSNILFIQQEGMITKKQYLEYNSNYEGEFGMKGPGLGEETEHDIP